MTPEEALEGKAEGVHYEISDKKIIFLTPLLAMYEPTRKPVCIECILATGIARPRGWLWWEELENFSLKKELA